MSRRPLSARTLAFVAASLVAPFAAQGDICVGLQLKALAEVPADGTPSALARGDFNRDGRLDLAVANRGSRDVAILLGDGAGGFAAATGSPIGVAGNPIDVAVADLDHDGFQDVVVALDGAPTTVRVLRGLAGAAFADAGTTTLGPEPNPAPERILLGQFTADANYDLVVLLGADQRVRLYGGGGLGFATAPIVDLVTTGETNDGGTLVDFNRDGKLDVAVASSSRDIVHVYFGDGTGRLVSGPSASAGADPVDVAAGDLDRDGWPDLVTADRGAGTASVFESATDGTTLAFAGSRSVGSQPTRVALSDLDHDGFLDLAVLDASATPRLTGVRGEKAAPYFETALYSAGLAAGSGPLGLAVGPFTADGRDDLAVAYSLLHQIVVVEDQSGMPCARASFAGAPRAYPAGDGPQASAAADFDHDGRSDLVVGAASDNSLRVLRNVDGGFVTGTVITGLLPAPRAVAVADLNVDGHVDVVVAQGALGSGKVQVYLGDGAGGLAAGVSQPAGDNTSAVVVGDVNGDGAPDVAAASETTGQVFVFLGNGAGGLGPGSPFTVGAGPRALAAAFLDADATLDLAVANSLGNTVTILSGNGAGAFTATATLAVGSGPQGIAAADLDGDAKLDLATADAGSGQVSVVLRTAAFGFQPAVAYAVGAGASGVALLNLEGDAKPDIAVTTFGSGSLKVLTNNGSGAFPTQSDHKVRNSPQAVTPIDADSDGLLDLAIPCKQADSVVVLTNRPSGSPALQSAPRVDVHDAPRAAVGGDFDANGTPDLAVANFGSGNVSLLSGDGLGGFTEYDALAVAAPEAIAAGDWNGDGRLDLAVSSASSGRVAIFLGSITVRGRFDAPTLVDASGRPDDLTAGDFDRDGDLDLAVCDKSEAGFVRLLRNTGGVFSAGQSVPVGKDPTAIVAADFDRDGDVDLAVANDNSDNVMVFPNSGGSFDTSQIHPLPGGDSSPVSLTAADFDGNGTPDLAVAAVGGDRVHVFKNGGSSFAPATAVDVPNIPSFVTSADLNRDGKPDLVVVADGLLFLRGRGGSALDFDPPQTVVARYTPSAAVVADFDRDGRNDVAVLDEGSDEISILRSTACQPQRLEVSGQPIPCAAGAPPFPFDATVKAFDDGGNVARCAAGSVGRSIVPGTGDPSAVLGGPPSLGFSDGVAAFTGANGLTLDRPGRYKLAFQTAGLPPVQTRSFTLGQAAPLQIIGPGSVCPASSGTYSLNQSFDTYAWTLTPPGGAPSLFTPAVILSGPPLSGAYQLGVVGRNECAATISRNIYFGSLASVSLAITGVSTVCVDCIGGSAKATELGGGAIVARQWGYRVVPGTGAITNLTGELGETYVLKGASFPGPGTYYVVVTSTPTCGPATVSSEWPVTVVASVPTGEVQHLAASSRGTSAVGENQLLWVNATGAAEEIRIRWNLAPVGTSSCLPPPSTTAPFDGEHVIPTPPGGMKGGFPHTGLFIDTAYCYSVFVKVAGVYSAGRTVKARAFDAATRPGHSVKWAYATGGTAVAPPTVSTPGIVVMSNDRTVHELTRGGTGGGLWPAPWLPAELAGVAHSRSPVVPFTIPIGSSDTVLFAADDVGFVHAIDAETGQRPWPAQSQGLPMTGAPGGMFTAFGGALDVLLVGTRDGSVGNQLKALKLADGTPLASYAPAGAPGPIGPINGTPAIDYATRRVYFASHSRAAGDTLWCLELNASPSPVFTYMWSRSLGNITGSPVLRGGRVYVGTDAGTVYSLNALTGALGEDRTFVTGDGPVKGFLFPDRRNDDLIFATNTKVWSVSDAASMTVNWTWTTAGLNPSVILYWPATSFVYVGSANGQLYELDFTSATPVLPPTSKLQVLGDGLGQVGAPSLDIGVSPRLLVVGSEAGVVYGVEVPFP